MNDLQTDPKLLDRLRQAAHVKLTVQQLRLQKISFIMGSLGDNSTITRERVERELSKFEGNAV